MNKEIKSYYKIHFGRKSVDSKCNENFHIVLEAGSDYQAICYAEEHLINEEDDIIIGRAEVINKEEWDRYN